MKQLHTIQLKILRDLLFSDSARYSEIKPIDMENSQFVFHLEKLIESGLIEKEDIAYRLTDAGKEYANKIDTDIVKISHQAKVTTILCAIKENPTSKEYLIYKRLKNPFYGCMGFPTEKPKWGETMEEAAKRGLAEEASLDGTPVLFAIRHYLVYSDQNGSLLEDKIMHAFMFVDPTGDLKGNLEGDYQWVKEKDLEKTVEPQLEEFPEILEALTKFKKEVTFKELRVRTSRF
ncbi:MAG: NUDIX domain-containing protein [Patescibacteria group bacterium]|jgi:ADP-ribose pyrophosphatase YjhB (NUDIX family)